MISAAPLNAWNLAQYEPLVASTVRHHLPSVSPQGPVFALGASCGEAPAGVVLAVRRGGTLEVSWLYVLASKRRLGVASALMTALEAWARERQARSMSIVLPTATDAAGPIEAFLRRWGFVKESGELVTAGIAATLATSPWFEQLRVPESLEVVRWSELASSQRAELTDALTREARPLQKALSPFMYEEGTHAETSLALCSAGEIIGWVMTHQIETELARQHDLGTLDQLLAKHRIVLRLLDDQRFGLLAGDSGHGRTPSESSRCSFTPGFCDTTSRRREPLTVPATACVMRMRCLRSESLSISRVRCGGGRNLSATGRASDCFAERSS